MNMILLYAILIILLEAIAEGLLKKHHLAEFIFKWWMQDIIAIGLFCIWFFTIALPFNGYYVPILKLVIGFVFVRFMIFDLVYNLSAGNKWNYYGKRKWYDRQMNKLGSWGWFMKGVLGIVGVCFLMGWE
jgi:hypothetical protein